MALSLSLLTAFSCFFVPFALLLLPQSLLGQFYQPPPFSAASSMSPYGGGLGGRYSLGGAYCCQPSAYPFYGKPSYAYVTPYGGYGLSGYEGPPYGQNTYWQPGVAYPPSYGSYGAYGAMGGACRDRSMDCAMLASSGQCASSASTRALCPMSCGLGCGQGDIYSGGGAASMLDPYSSAYRGSSQLPPLGLPPLGQQSPLGARPLMNGGFDLAASSLSAAAAIASPFEQMPPFFCRDSHIFGCPNWAQQGFCQTVPEFMLNYCRASCGVCGGAGGGFGLGGPEGFAASTIMGPASSFSMDPFGSGLGGVGFSPLGPQQLDSPMAAAQLLSLGQAPAMSAGMYAPYLPYAPYYPFKSSSVFGAERKEKQQRNGGTKLMFNEDDQQDMQLFAAGLNSGISPPGQLASGLSSASSLPNPSQMLPPSSLSTQHSSVSKLVRMDDLLFDGKKQRKN